MAASTNTPLPQTLRILCLHGGRQCGEIFSQRLRTTARRLRRHAKRDNEDGGGGDSGGRAARSGPRRPRATYALVCPDAPFELPLEDGQTVPTRVWYRRDARDPAAARRDMEISVRHVADIVAREGPFHSAFAFSQGTAVVAACLGAGVLGAHNLTCVVLAGGLLMDDSAAPSIPWDVPSLHFAGSEDTLVSSDRSRRLAAAFRSPEFCLHGAGHVFPSRADESNRLLRFLERFIPAEKDVSPPAAPTPAPVALASSSSAASLSGSGGGGSSSGPTVPPVPFTPSEELQDELEALESIYPDEFAREPPCGCVVTVTAGPFRIELAFAFTSEYPETAAVGVAVRSSTGCSTRLVSRALSLARDAATAGRGEPSVFSVVQEVQGFLEGDEAPTLMVAVGGEVEAQQDTNAGDDDDPSALDDPGDGGDISPEDLRALTQEASLDAVQQRRDENSGARAARRRAKMYWGNFCAGLIGKPSAGKSTFFNACKTIGTRAARVGAFPFTTIEPNIGRGAYWTSWPAAVVVPHQGSTLDSASSSPSSPSSSSARPGMHSLEIVLKDVAGLVPGAYEGRGKGNRFLDDLCEADLLVHVVDASGGTDDNGNDTGVLGEGVGDPARDIDWVYSEVHRWVFGNVWHKFRQRVRRRARHGQECSDVLAGLFTGYHNTKELVYTAARRAGLDLGAESLATWTSVQVHRLVAFFVRARFPILVAMNKCDDPRSARHVQRVQDMYPHETVIAMSAYAETLRQQKEKEKMAETAAISPGSVGVGLGSIKAAAQNDAGGHGENGNEALVVARCLAQLGGTTGVQRVIDAAVGLGNPMVVYIITKTLSSGMTLETGDVVPLLFRQGVNAGDVYEYLRHTDDPRVKVTGEFIRAEAVGVGGVRTVLKKDEPLDEGTRCIKVFTNRAKSWQKGAKSAAAASSGSQKSGAKDKKGGGSGGSDGGGGGGGGGGRADKKTRDRDRLIKRLHKSSDRQGKSKGGKGTGQDRRTTR